MRKSNYFTVTRLLTMAAESLLANADRTESHAHIEDCINGVAGVYKFPNSARARAHKVVRILYRTDDRVMADFGKRWSESRNEHAITNVIRNREHRVMALLMAAEFARSPIRTKFKQASTAPTPVSATIV